MTETKNLENKDFDEIIIYRDKSAASEELISDIQKLRIPFKIFYRAPSEDVPSIETPYGTVRTLENIYRYFNLRPCENSE